MSGFSGGICSGAIMTGFPITFHRQGAVLDVVAQPLHLFLATDGVVRVVLLEPVLLGAVVAQVQGAEVHELAPTEVTVEVLAVGEAVDAGGHPLEVGFFGGVLTLVPIAFFTLSVVDGAF